MLKLTRVYFEGVELACSVMSGLKQYHPRMVAKFVDAVLEEITGALDEPRPASQQRYLTMLKLIGELYNFKVLDSNVVFAVLYMILNRGHALRVGTPAHQNALRLSVVNPLRDLDLRTDSEEEPLPASESAPGV